MEAEKSQKMMPLIIGNLDGKLRLDMKFSRLYFALVTVGILFELIFGRLVLAFELVVIQSISASKRSFVTRTGKQSGITPGQKATFTTQSISLLAKTTAVNREYAVWEVVDPQVQIPFKKNEVVEYNSSLEGIYTNIKRYEEELKINSELKKKKIAIELPSFIVFKTHYAKTISDSTSDVSDQEINRQANNYEIFYQKALNKYFFWGAGIRYDAEAIEGETFNQFTTRLLGLLDLSFHLPQMTALNANLYLGASVAYGTISSEIQGETTAGRSLVLPHVRAGIQSPIHESFLVLAEVGIESNSSSEEFSNGVNQTTDLTNVKAAVGLKYRF